MRIRRIQTYSIQYVEFFVVLKRLKWFCYYVVAENRRYGYNLIIIALKRKPANKNRPAARYPSQSVSQSFATTWNSQLRLFIKGLSKRRTLN